MRKMKLIVLCGPDGSGKSTQIKNISEYWKKLNLKHRSVSIWDSISKMYPGESRVEASKKIDNLLQLVNPLSRTQFLSSSLIDSFFEGAKDLQSEILLCDGYFYKYWATEKAHGTDPELLKDLEKYFPEPDLIIYLDVHPEVAFKRKKRFSKYESGFYDLKTNKEKALNFQKMASLHLQKDLSDRPNVHTVRGRESKDEVFFEIKRILNEYLGSTHESARQ